MFRPPLMKLSLTSVAVVRFAKQGDNDWLNEPFLTVLTVDKHYLFDIS